MTTDPSSPRGLAPSATPAIAYGIMGLSLCWVPVVGFLLGWMAYLRARQALVQLRCDDRLEGAGLQRGGRACGVVAMILGITSTAVWTVILLLPTPPS